MPSEKILLEKQAAVSALKEKILNSVSCVLVDYKGINVENDTKLRKELREAGVSYTVLKNSIMRFAFNDTPYADLTKYLEGTTAIALSEADMTAPARIIAKYAKETKEGFNLKAGFVDGDILDTDGVVALSQLPSKEVLIAQVLGAMNGVIRNYAVVLDQIREKKEAEAPAS